MERETPINAFQTNSTVDLASLTIQNRVRNFLGLPKSVRGDFVDNEECSWRMLNQSKIDQENFFF
jgi:hypothetical protein